MGEKRTTRDETRQYLAGLTAADLDTCLHPEQRPGYTIGKMFSHLIVEESQHVGQIGYLRGLQYITQVHKASCVSVRCRVAAFHRSQKAHAVRVSGRIR